MRAVTYARVSSDMQLDGYSLEAQHDVNLKLIASKGWQHVGAYRDEAQSARTTDRPDFQRMLEDARAGYFDVIVVHKLDRFSRSVVDVLITLRDLEKYGVTLVSATEDFDFTTPAGRMLLVMLAAFAEWYLHNLSVETAKGNKARAHAGLWNGSLPYGYYANYKKEGGDGIAYIDEDAAAGVRLAFQAYSTGAYSHADIARLLNESGYRPAQRHGKHSLPMWSKDSVAVILQNRFYTGQVQYKGEWLEGLHEPIVSAELFERVQAVRVERRVNRRENSAPRQARIYLCTGLVRCARCGHRMRVHPAKRQTYHYYSCDHNLRQHECDQPYIPLAPVEEQVAAFLCSIRLPHDWQEQVQALVQAKARQQVGPKVTRSQLENRLTRLTDLYKWEHISQEEYLTERKDIEAQLAQLEPRLTPAVDRAGTLLQNFAAVWKVATRKEQRSLVRTLIERVVLDSEAPSGVAEIVVRSEYKDLFDLAKQRTGEE